MKRWWILPLLLIVLAFGLRLAGALSLPAPYWEEVALGYDAYSLIKTGRDHHGNILPLVAFPSFGDYKPSLYFYAVVPSIALFGLNPLAVRLPAIIASSLMVGVWWWLMKRWTNPRAAFWSGLFLAVQPWSWQVGQAGFEANLASLLFLGALACFQAWKDASVKNAALLLISSLCAGLSLYAYHGARIWMPVAGLILASDWLITTSFATMRKQFPQIVFSLAVLAILLLPIFFFLRSPVISQRFQETSIFSSSKPLAQSVQAQELTGRTLASRVLEHRYWYWARLLASNYLDHFSPAFLFADGDINPRHTSHFFGAVYPWEAVLIFLALVWGWKKFRSGSDRSIFVALFLSIPIAAALTVTTPHTLRALPLSAWYAGLSGIGATIAIDFFSKKKRAMVACTLVTILLASTSLLALYLWRVYPTLNAIEWQYGYEELFDTLVKEKQPQEKVFVSRLTGRPAMYLFFTQKVEPSRVQDFRPRAQLDQQEFLTFEDWTFHVGGNTEPGLHAITKGDEVPHSATLIKTISFPNGQPAWFIYRL